MTDAREQDATQDLAQFEPDPDGLGDRDPRAEAEKLAAEAAPDDVSWIAWPDESGESAWAAEELRELTGVRTPR